MSRRPTSASSTPLAEGGLGASVLSYRPDRDEDGYFLLLASPDVDRGRRRRGPRPRRSSSCSTAPARCPARRSSRPATPSRFVLDNLRDDDTFNIVAYDDRVETFKPELQRFDPDARKEAERFVDNIRAGGSTNIDAALRTALEMLHDDDRPQYVLFLTDGLPTAGETDELQIAEHARARQSPATPGSSPSASATT